MNTMSALATPVAPLKPLPTAASGVAMLGSEQAKRAAIKKTAQDFEASFLSQAFGSMSEGVEISEPFGGGQGEKMFKSFLNDAMAKQVVKSGGIGVAASVQREMLKMQGLSQETAK